MLVLPDASRGDVYHPSPGFAIGSLACRLNLECCELALRFDIVYQALRLKSEEGAGEEDVVELRAHGGWLSMLNTEVMHTHCSRL